tara:strand:- start:213 stop:413 length:201 start_codon:yes stop_codon:yes gene_type:complete
MNNYTVLSPYLHKKKHFYIAHKDDEEEYYGLRTHAVKRKGILLDCKQAEYLAEELLKFAHEEKEEV